MKISPSYSHNVYHKSTHFLCLTVFLLTFRFCQPRKWKSLSRIIFQDTNFQKKRKILMVRQMCTVCPKKCCPVLYGYRGGALLSVVQFLTQFHMIGFKLEFETLFLAISQEVITYVWHTKSENSKCFKLWVLGNVEVLIRFIIVVKNKNCQAYLCVFSGFPSSPLSRRFSISNLLPFASLFIQFQRRNQVVDLCFSSLFSLHPLIC